MIDEHFLGESVCERQGIRKKEKVLGIWAVDGFHAILRHMVVVASKVKYFIVLSTILEIISDFVQKNLIHYLTAPEIFLLRFKKQE